MIRAQHEAGQSYSPDSSENETLRQALALLDTGISFIPTGDNKLPASWTLPRDPADETKGTWKPLQNRLPTREEINQWFAGPRSRYGIARVHGAVSGNLETLDFDVEPDLIGLELDAVIAEWERLVEEIAPGLVAQLTKIQTPRPGVHYCYRCEEPVDGNQKLAETPELDPRTRQPVLLSNGEPRWKAFIETRGEGGYACGPGTPAENHPAKRGYEHIGGPPLHKVATISAEERLVLLNAARMMSRKHEGSEEKAAGQRTNGHSCDRAGDDYNARTTWDELLTNQNWTKVFERGDVGHWKRPGTNCKWSATTNYGGRDLLYVFTTGLPIPANRAYNRFQFYAFMEHGGDFSAAAKALAAQGYGKPPNRNDAQPEHGEPNGKRKRRKRTRDPESEWRPFPVEALPGDVAGHVTAAAAAIGCDATYVVLPLLACLGRAIGNRRAIRLKRTWEEIPIIWGAIIGKSGTHKSPALKATTTFLQARQAEAIAQHAEAKARYEQDRAVYERDYAEWKRKKGNNDPPPWDPVEPVCERYITTDITMEALEARLAQQFDGLLLARDEMAGWFGGIAEYKGGKGSDLGHWLAMWSGAPLTVERKTGEPKFLYIPRASASLVGGIQPEVLKKAIGREHLQDGLCARLLVVMPPARRVRWSEAIIAPAAEEALRRLFDRLFALEPAADPEGQPAPFSVPLSAEAKQVWVAYYNRHRSELALLDDDLAAAWSKLEAYTARFALIFALCDGPGDVIDKQSMEAAITVSDWFGREAKRVYGLFSEDEAEREQRDLVELIQRRDGRISPRELSQASRRFRPVEVAEEALDELVQAEYGYWEVTSTATNQKREFVLFLSTNSHEPSDLGESVDVDSVDSSANEAADGQCGEWGEI